MPRNLAGTSGQKGLRMADQLEFKVSEGLIKPIIHAKINAAIVEAMEGHERMIVEMVSAFMNQKVDHDGKASGYGANVPRVEWLANRLLEDAIKSALEKFLTEKKEFIAREVEKFFASKKGSSQLIEAMQGGIIKSLSDRWLTTISFNVKPVK